jgi:membrane associated rhomboid family serine protease
MFLHLSFFHLIGNVLYLWLYGGDVEDRIGSRKFLLLYLLCGVLSGVTHSILTNHFLPTMAHVPCIGASGAIAGILGMFLVRFFYLKVEFFYFFWIIIPKFGRFKLNTIIAMIFWFLLQTFYGLMSLELGGGGIAYWAHVGGFLSGVLLGYLFGLGKEGRKEAILHKANCYLIDGKIDEAQEAYQKFKRLFPQDERGYIGLAKLYSSLNQPEKAKAEYEVALHLMLKEDSLPEEKEEEIIDFPDELSSCRLGREELRKLAFIYEKRGLHEQALRILGMGDGA